MSRIATTFLCVSPLAFLLSISACSSTGASPADGGSPADEGSPADGGSPAEGGALNDAGSGAETSSTPVSFRRDVLPVFQSSCAASGASCHGDQNTTPGALRLGSSDGGDPDAQSILAQIVGVKAAEDPAMNLVTATDPTQSFLMLKLDGTQATQKKQCAASSYNNQYPACGSLMPLTPPVVLPAMTRDAVRNWIQQGASDN